MMSPGSTAGNVHEQATVPPPSMATSNAPRADLSPAVGTVLGDFELLQELGRGGMGVVFKARQRSLQRIVALKMILSGRLAGAEDLRRFRREAEAAAGLDHPGIVPIFEVDEEQGLAFYSMAYVAGETLAQRVARGPWPPIAAAECVAHMAAAVEYAHQKGIIHRDLKPGNVLLDESGHPRITDFGLATTIQPKDESSETGGMVGTVSYMPPEQADSRGKIIGPTADVYALGATLYCLLTGRPPFQSATVLDTLFQVLQQPPVSPRQLNPALPRDLETICLKCLEKEPGRRYASARALEADLRAYLDDRPITARPPSRWEELRRWSRRNPGRATSLVISSFAAASTLVVSLLFNFLLQEQKQEAVEAALQSRRLQLALQKLLDDVSQLRDAGRGTAALRYRQVAHLVGLMDERARGDTSRSEQDWRTEFQQGLAGVLQHSQDPQAPTQLREMQSLLNNPQASATEWKEATERQTALSRQQWASITENLDDVRRQVQQIVAGQFVAAATQLIAADQSSSLASLRRSLQNLRAGEVAVLLDPATIDAMDLFLSAAFPGDRSAPTSQQWRAIRQLQAELERISTSSAPSAGKR